MARGGLKNQNSNGRPGCGVDSPGVGVPVGATVAVLPMISGGAFGVSVGVPVTVGVLPMISGGAYGVSVGVGPVGVGVFTMIMGGT